MFPLPFVRSATLLFLDPSRSHEVSHHGSTVDSPQQVPSIGGSDPRQSVLSSRPPGHHVLAHCRVLLPAPLRSPRFPHIDISCAEQGPGLVVVGEAPVVPCCASPPGTYRQPCCRRRRTGEVTGEVTGLGGAPLGTPQVPLSSSTSYRPKTLDPPLDHSMIIPRHPKP